MLLLCSNLYKFNSFITGPNRHNIRFRNVWTLVIPLNEYIKNLNTMFYAQRIKIIPKSIIKDLSLRTVAHLIMDDGTVLTGNQCRICTNCFDLDSLESLKLGFAKLGIKIDKKF